MALQLDVWVLKENQNPSTSCGVHIYGSKSVMGLVFLFEIRPRKGLTRRQSVKQSYYDQLLSDRLLNCIFHFSSGQFTGIAIFHAWKHRDKKHITSMGWLNNSTASDFWFGEFTFFFLDPNGTESVFSPKTENQNDSHQYMK